MEDWFGTHDGLLLTKNDKLKKFLGLPSSDDCGGRLNLVAWNGQILYTNHDDAINSSFEKHDNEVGAPTTSHYESFGVVRSCQIYGV